MYTIGHTVERRISLARLLDTNISKCPNEYTSVSVRGCSFPPPFSLGAAKAGRNYLKKQNTTRLVYPLI